MAIKIHDLGYACSICSRVYSDPVKADKCRDEHDVTFIPMTSHEINGLVHGLQLGDLSLVPTSLYDKLYKVMRTLVTKDL